MHTSMLCADRADWSCAAMYTNATEFPNKSSEGKTGHIQKSYFNSNVFFYVRFIDFCA